MCNNREIIQNENWDAVSKNFDGMTSFFLTKSIENLIDYAQEKTKSNDLDGNLIIFFLITNIKYNLKISKKKNSFRKH